MPMHQNKPLYEGLELTRCEEMSFRRYDGSLDDDFRAYEHWTRVWQEDSWLPAARLVKKGGPYFVHPWTNKIYGDYYGNAPDEFPENEEEEKDLCQSGDTENKRKYKRIKKSGTTLLDATTANMLIRVHEAIGNYNGKYGPQYGKTAQKWFEHLPLIIAVDKGWDMVSK